MAKPHTKALILSESEKERNALEELLQALTADEMTRPDIVGSWSVKDVLAHLYEWEQMVLRWLAASRRGETPAVPAAGYKWNQLPALNETIFQTYRGRSLSEIQQLSQTSYREITATIEALDEETLFAAGLYPWMNKNNLATYFTSATSSHYRWARKEIRKGLRAQAHAG